MKTFNTIVKYANSYGVAVEKSGNWYESWNKNNSSVVALSNNLKDLMNDIYDLTEKENENIQRYN